jgi:translation elongation factor EF-1beta
MHIQKKIKKTYNIKVQSHEPLGYELRRVKMKAYVEISFYDEEAKIERIHKSIKIDFEKSLNLECGKRYIFGKNVCFLRSTNLDVHEKIHKLDAVAVTPVKEEVNEIIEVINNTIKKENPKKAPSIGGIFAEDINIAAESS